MAAPTEHLFYLISESPANRWFPNNAEMLKLAEFLISMGVSTPDVCPICKGNGVVPGNYYHRSGVDISHGNYLELQTKTTLCRECNGTGRTKKE